MLIELEHLLSYSCSYKRGLRKACPGAQTLLIPTMVAAFLMAVALAGCSAAPHNPQPEATAILIHSEAVGQDNGNLMGNFSKPRRTARRHNALYVAAAARPLFTPVRR